MSWLYSNDYSVRVPRRHAWMHGRRTATAVPPRQLRGDVVRKRGVPNGWRGAGTAALEEAPWGGSLDRAIVGVSFGGACDYSFWRCTDLLRPWSVFCRFLVYRRPMHQVLLLCRPLYPPLSTETHPDLVSPDGSLIITFLRAPPHHTPLDRRPP